jgi:hypothetical protein
LRPDEQPGSAQSNPAAREQQIIVNQVDEVLDRLEACDRDSIDLVADNAGVELVCDLFLAHALIATGRAGQVHLHLKAHPTFVSDATVADVHHTLKTLADHDDDHPDQPQLASLALEILAYVDRQQIKLQAHPFWTSPLAAWDLPADLRHSMMQSRLVICKGDANYRRLLGDRTWVFTQSFTEIVRYFPASLLALRTLKSDVAAGLDAETVKSLTAQDPAWMTTGNWGVIQTWLK